MYYVCMCILYICIGGRLTGEHSCPKVMKSESAREKQRSRDSIRHWLWCILETLRLRYTSSCSRHLSASPQQVCHGHEVLKQRTTSRWACEDAELGTGRPVAVELWLSKNRSSFARTRGQEPLRSAVADKQLSSMYLNNTRNVNWPQQTLQL